MECLSLANTDDLIVFETDNRTRDTELKPRTIHPR